MTQGPNVMRHGRELEAEERVGALLERELDDVAIVLHDLHVPGCEVRIDHVVVAPTGIWVIDSTLRGELELEVNAVDASASGAAIERHVAVMASAVSGRAKDVSIRAALCFATE